MSGKRGRLGWLELYGLIKLFYRAHIPLKRIVGQFLLNASIYRYDTGMSLRWCKAAKGEEWAPPIICCIFINKGLLTHCPLWS